MTLTELAYGLRKIFKFKYLYLGELLFGNAVENVVTLSNAILSSNKIDEGGEGCPCYVHEWNGDVLIDVCLNDLSVSLDLSEYKDETGKVDYSRCIVDLSEYKED